VFNNIMYRHLLELARPAGAADRSALIIAGDDGAAKATATRFLDAIGYDTVDVGPLSESWRFEPDTPAYGLPYLGPEMLTGPGRPAAAAELRSALAEAGTSRVHR
jgi:predicted dinucleotide-binding enzyme